MIYLNSNFILKYAIDEGAKSVVGIVISEQMLNEAKKNTESKLIEY